MSQTILEGPLLVEVKNQVMTITFNQPKKMNALSNDMVSQLRDLVLGSKENDEVRVIVLQGMGDHFATGADLNPKDIANKDFSLYDFVTQNYNKLVMGMVEMDKPIIAKVRGNCVGAAFNIALACDLMYADETARFSEIFTRIGFSCDAGGGFLLPARVGYHKAFELMAFAEMIPADEALKLNLVNKIFPAAELDQAVDKISQALATGPYLAIQRTKANLRAGVHQGLAAALETEAINQDKNFKSKDFMEGLSAFLQKREPNFKGE
ncbi:MAG: enoyl-CoA hydratase-related protein [Bacteroidota bacterium]